MHTYSWLWEFHKFHHSAETLNPFTVYRVHPVESILLNSFGGICSGLVTGIFVYFFPAITMYSFLGVNFGLFLFHIYSNLRHTQVWISFSNALSYILLSPAQHQIHHSKKELHQNKNYGAIFGFWDYFANSIYIPKEREKLEFGLPTVGNPLDYTSLPRIFFVPFKKAFTIIAQSSRRSWSVETVPAEFQSEVYPIHILYPVNFFLSERETIFAQGVCNLEMHLQDRRRG